MWNMFYDSFRMAANAKCIPQLVQKVNPKLSKQSHDFAKILLIWMIAHNMTLFEMICAAYQFHRTLPFMKIDRG